MLPNPNVYGTPENWTASQYNIGDVYFPEWGTLRNGVNNNKIALSDTLDKSITFVGLGAESVYSNIISVDKDGHFVEDSRPVTNWFLSYGDLSQRYYLANDTNALTWDVDNLESIPVNRNADLRPIINFKPNKILWWILVTASSVPDASYDHQIIAVRLYQYVENVNNWRNDYPYIKAVYMVPAFDISDTETPNRLTTGNIINLSINERRNIYGKSDFITFTDLSLVPIPALLTAHTTRQGILLRGGREGLGDNWCFNNYCVYFLGDKSSIIPSVNTHYTYAEEFDENVLAEIIKAAACFCMPFIADIPIPEGYTVNDVPLDSPCVYWGYPDANGVSHGNYTVGADNLIDNVVATWTDSTKSPYDYTNIDENTYSGKTTFNNIGNLASMLKRYVLTASGVDALGVDLWTICGDLAQTTSDLTFSEKCIDGFLTNNPINAIVKLERYPLNSIPYTGDLTNLKLGKYQASTGGYVMPYTSMTYDFKKINIAPKFGNSFLDYNPYTVYQLYVPFCGTTDLNPSDFIGKTLSVRMVIDFTTGSCTAYILSNGLAIKTLNGSCSIDVPVTGTESATVMANINNAMIQERTANANKVALIGGTASLKGLKEVVFNPVDYSKNVVNTKWAAAGAEYNLTHQQIPINTIGAATSAASWAIDLKCRLIIYYPTGAAIDDSEYTPKLANLDSYAHINGFATVENGQLKDYSGFTQCAGVDLSGVPATNDEKNMILTLLSSGIYI